MSKPFIDVIPESLIQNTSYVERVIKENAQKSLSMRKQIREYAETFSWGNVIENVYVPAVRKILEK